MVFIKDTTEQNAPVRLIKILTKIALFTEHSGLAEQKSEIIADPFMLFAMSLHMNRQTT